MTASEFPVQQISLGLIEFLRKDGGRLDERRKVGEGWKVCVYVGGGVFNRGVFCCVLCLKIESQPQTVDLP